MSYTTMYAAFEDGDLNEVAEFGNSWGSAMFVWVALCERYVPGSKTDLFGSLDKLFAKANNLGLEPWEWNVLRFTYDKTLFMREALLVIADSLDRFATEYDDEGRVCHMRAEAAAIRKAHGEGARAVAITQTSTVCTLWDGIFDPDSEDPRPYNIDKDSSHDVIEVVPWPERG